MDKERIIIIDGSSYFFRAFYGVPRLTTSKGLPTNAIYGFINMLMRVLEVEKPTKLAIAFDTAKPSFRKEIYKEYKSNRQAPPEDLVVQIPYIQEAVDCFGIHRVECDGFEADDVIGTLARRAEKDGYRVEIITGDKDLMQLVNKDITLYDTMKDKRYNIQGVVEKLQVEPEQVIDFLALMGDSSDNIPGVNGIGEKTAAELIKQFGSLESLYQRLDEIKQPKRRETLLKERGIAFLSRDLATVRCNLPLKFQWKELSYDGPIQPKLQHFLEQMEFQNLMKRLGLKPSEGESAFHPGKYSGIATEKELVALCEKIRERKMVSVDTETSSLIIHTARLAGISLSCQEGEAYYIPVGHHAPGDPSNLLVGQLPEALVRKHVKPILEDGEIKKVGQNIKYDLQILRNWGIELGGIYADTLLESYLLNPDEPHNLDSLTFRHLGHQNITYEDVTGKGRNQILFPEVSLEKAVPYSSEDADVTLRLHNKLYPELKKQDLLPLFHDIEVPLMKVLADMEFGGISVNRERLEKMGAELEEELVLVEKKIYSLGDGAFNISSPKQLSQVLFEKLKLPVIRKTKTGLSTDEGVLEQLKDKHEICECILKFRGLSKLKGTYVEGLLTQIHPVTKKVHTHYNQRVTATGRLSSSDPNLQNIPVGEGKYDIRSVFVASPGHEFLSADYSQVELRLLAHMSQDPELMRAFENDEDVHEYTGRLIFQSEEVTPEQRRMAKTINFGVIYGQTPFGLSQTLKISMHDAKAFIDRYFARYAKVKDYLHQLVVEGREKGYVTTLSGRRRYLPDLKTENRMRREMAERAAINAPVQGTAADMIKIAMVNIARKLEATHMKSRMILQVHDELVFDVEKNEKSKIETLVRQEMEGALELKVPIKVDIGWGKNWSECG